HVERAVAAQDVDPYIAFSVSGEQKIDARLVYFQVTNGHLRKESRQNWLGKYQSVFWSRHAQAKTCFHQKEDGAGRPRLRSARYGIQRGGFTWAPGKTAK